MDHAYIFGPQKADAQEEVISPERLEEIRLIAKRICKDYDILWDENGEIPTMNGKPIRPGEVARAFDD